MLHQNRTEKLIQKAEDKASQIYPCKLDKQNSEQLDRRFNGLISHLFTLLRQETAIRGKDDTNSNIIQFNLDKSRTDENLIFFLKSRSYFSRAILSEQEQMLVLEAKMKILEEIRRTGYFALSADEATDVSKKGQLSITLRECTKDFVVKE
eukprot:gene11329-21520_t